MDPVASAATPPSAGSGAGRGVMVRTSRGGPTTGAAGLGGGSGARAGAFLALPPLAGTAVSRNICAGGGRVMPRWRACRSTNWRATTSSIVLDALFTSMP